MYSLKTLKKTLVGNSDYHPNKHQEKNLSIKYDMFMNEFDDFTYDDIEVIDYEHHPHISAPISI